MEVRLEWEGKPTLVERLSLPFQTVETINESRATRERDTGALFAGGERLGTADYNRLIWGDNKVVMSSLLDEYAGRLKLIYIDPPFDTGADFAYRVSVGEAAVEKLPSILEEHAYRDTWGKGRGSYLTMLYERLVLMHELLAGDGSLFVHLDWHQGHYVKVLLDEIFGQGRFLNEIVWWYYNKFQGNINRFASNHDVIFWYTNSPAPQASGSACWLARGDIYGAPQRGDFRDRGGRPAARDSRPRRARPGRGRAGAPRKERAIARARRASGPAGP